MKKALISPKESVSHIVGWNELVDPAQPIFEKYENSTRIAEVCDQQFEVAYPMFWIDCEDNIVADQYWYNIETSQILPVENVPMPTVQPVTEGTQTL